MPPSLKNLEVLFCSFLSCCLLCCRRRGISTAFCSAWTLSAGLSFSDSSTAFHKVARPVNSLGALGGEAFIESFQPSRISNTCVLGGRGGLVSENFGSHR